MPQRQGSLDMTLPTRERDTTREGSLNRLGLKDMSAIAFAQTSSRFMTSGGTPANRGTPNRHNTMIKTHKSLSNSPDRIGAKNISSGLIDLKGRSPSKKV